LEVGCHADYLAWRSTDGQLTTFGYIYASWSLRA
jgi:hypothetical protein